MKIASSDILLSGRHAAVESREVRESLRMWVGERRPDFEDQGRRPNSPPGMARVDTVRLSPEARAAQPSKQAAPPDAELTPEDELKLTMLVDMIAVLTGKKIKLISPKELSDKLAAAQEQAQEHAGGLSKIHQRDDAAARPAGFGIEYDYYERYYEAEKTTFSATGLIKTQDGREIAFSLDLSMSREFLREQNVSLRVGDARLKDPLVLNFEGNAAELTSTRFSFDIDSNGQPRQIAFVGSDSGFLALDRNGDGVINNGRELFGPATGDGFAELAAHDEDGNGWIDENDSVYQHLRIWSKDARGQDQLVALGERGVGAIYLGHVASPFALKDDDNALLGQIRSSGVFLNENGTVGTVQQIDLAI
ncbi:MAG: hypothetical protein U5O69_05535 [Candidatus Competibacteraceae bacterium]|nr:hypothetical protein [Candidatus Competibacteraceae bacterium]